MLLSVRGLRDYVRMAAGCLRYPCYPLLITIVLTVRHCRRNRVDQGKNFYVEPSKCEYNVGTF